LSRRYADNIMAAAVHPIVSIRYFTRPP